MVSLCLSDAHTDIGSVVTEPWPLSAPMGPILQSLGETWSGEMKDGDAIHFDYKIVGMNDAFRKFNSFF